ncbi:MAG: winged helix-turn-helix transcriptional regulator [Melioribacteraceae bacterium]|nr:winged helix-turn-helix transcriptional regulator [Melioribacteraceae bacterium]
MVHSKEELYTQQEIELSKIAKALSHPARVKIINILNKRGICITGELVDLLPLAQATVSQHLRELKESGIIKGEIEGPRTCYCIEPKMMKKAKEAFTKLFSKLNCC